MRNGLEIGEGLIVTTDNSGGIGEKQADLVYVPDEVTARFAARVALLEQWAAYAQPLAIIIHNFSGEKSWEKYVQGVSSLFHEIGIQVPQIKGSTETNMMLEQSALAVTMIGKAYRSPQEEHLHWYTYGKPLVGNEVVEQAEEVASIRRIHQAVQSGIIERVWPVGSRGILYEVQMLTRNEHVRVKSVHNLEKSAGPATTVLVGIKEEQRAFAVDFFGEKLQELFIELK